jgi:hypothetical protein
LRTASPVVEDTRVVDDLCVTGAVESTNWAKDAKGQTWLAMLGIHPETGQPRLFSLRIPLPGEPGAGYAVRDLASMEGISGPLRARPTGPHLDIYPRVARLPDRLPAPARPAGDGISAGDLAPGILPAGSLLYTRPQVDGSAIEMAHPDGSRREVLLPAGDEHTCPVASPDGSRLAFLSNLTSSRSGANQVFLLNEEESVPLQLSRSALPRPLSRGLAGAFPTRYDCPVWAPDGQALAAVLRTARGAYLSLLPIDGSQPLYLEVPEPSSSTVPVWTPDGRVLLVIPGSDDNPVRIIAFDVAAPGQLATTLAELPGWSDAQAMSISPDGQRLALLLVREGSFSRAGGGALRMLDASSGRPFLTRELLGYNPAVQSGPGRIIWIQDNQVIFAYQGNPNQRYKASLLRYIPRDDTLDYLVYLEDPLIDWTVKGGWLVYSSESGLWGLPLQGAYDPPVLPFWLDEDPVRGLGWY